MENKLVYEEFATSPDVIQARHICMSQETIAVEHFHNQYEMLLVLKGSCTFLHQNHVYSLEPNDICMISPDGVHAMFCTEPYHEHIFLNFTDFYIDPELAYDVKKLWACGKYSPRPEDVNYFRELFEELCEYAQNRERFYANYLKTCFDRIFIKMLRTPLQFATHSNQETSAEEISKVIEYVSNKYSLDITLEQMAEMCHIAPTYFSRLFKKQVGIGFKEFLIFTRLHAAEKMLSTTNYSISYIASECGFNDSNYFSMIFKKRYGLPPLQYRKQNTSTQEKPEG